MSQPVDSPEQTPKKEEEMSTNTSALWLPPGSVRAILALIITGFTCYNVAFSGFVLPDWWNSMFMGVIVAYFGKDIISSVASKLPGGK